MGKPFKKELFKINETFQWAQSIDIDVIKMNFEELSESPTLVVGSGGSFSACHFLSLLIQHSKGIVSKPLTPLELHYSRSILKKTNIFFLSASGKNSDILFAYETAINHDPEKIFGLCMKKNTKLGDIAKKHSISKIIELDCPTGKDGFLATNSLISYFIVLSRLFGYKYDFNSFQLSNKQEDEIKAFVNRLDESFSLIVLYAGWGQPVAIDLESKFTEAGLGNVLYSDFRNFGHGRHNWFDKKKKESAIVAIITPDVKELAEKTLSFLPNHIPQLILSTNYSFSASTIDLLVQSFYFVNYVGEKVGIDPGRPGVPPYGSKLYNLQYKSIFDDKKNEYTRINAILKKANKRTIGELNPDEILYWNESYKNHKLKINNAKFGAIIFDYDGTLCTKEERKKLPSTEISNLLNQFAKNGFVVGIVTGRGKSIRENLVKCIEKKHWKNIIVGYYNGAIIASLTDESQPTVDAKPHKALKIIFDTISNYNFFNKMPDLALRPLQLTIEKGEVGDWNSCKQVLIELIGKLKLKDVRVLESGHSLDIIAIPEVSKTNIFKYCIDKCVEMNIEKNFLCIGDKGKFPGNDYELLSTSYSLSVDEVSSDPHTCWNFSEPGNRGVATCLQYLSSIKFNKSNFIVSL